MVGHASRRQFLRQVGAAAAGAALVALGAAGEIEPEPLRVTCTFSWYARVPQPDGRKRFVDHTSVFLNRDFARGKRDAAALRRILREYMRRSRPGYVAEAVESIVSPDGRVVDLRIAYVQAAAGAAA